MTVAASKAALRKRMAATMAALTPAAIAAESAAVVQRLFASEAYQAARTVSCYLSMPAELQTREIIADAAKQKTLLVPRITGKRREDMVMLRIVPEESVDAFPKSRWGIPEPPLTFADGSARTQWRDVSPPLDLVIVPGVAFSKDGKRLGHGKGYYDTFLETLSADYEQRGLTKPLVVGICLSCQLVASEDVPCEEWDRRVDLVLTA
ncbi:5-formyltetrahydrofolate cyclo-ligase [Hyaloraphidium curvatum]|nr:5-formyltetrahydrofolate cyclo-ligase [Hyaloraphidium curvatum]